MSSLGAVTARIMVRFRLSWVPLLVVTLYDRGSGQASVRVAGCHVWERCSQVRTGCPGESSGSFSPAR